MSLIQGLWTYAAFAVSLALTSYLILFRPAIVYTEEILAEKSIYNGILGTITWLGLASVLAPATILMLLYNDNESVIKSLAVNMAEYQLEGDEE